MLAKPKTNWKRSHPSMKWYIPMKGTKLEHTVHLSLWILWFLHRKILFLIFQFTVSGATSIFLCNNSQSMNLVTILSFISGCLHASRAKGSCSCRSIWVDVALWGVLLEKDSLIIFFSFYNIFFHFVSYYRQCLHNMVLKSHRWVNKWKIHTIHEYQTTTDYRRRLLNSVAWIIEEPYNGKKIQWNKEFIRYTWMKHVQRSTFNVHSITCANVTHESYEKDF